MALTKERVQEILTEKYGEQLSGWVDTFGVQTCTIPADLNLDILTFLFNTEELNFRFLTDLTAVHYPDRKGEELCVVYHLHNMQQRLRLRLKAYVPIEQPDIKSVVELHSGANWMERETYDYFGVNFVGHPDLRRILNVDEMDYFPMRKEYPMEDPTRMDKDDEMFGRGDIIK